MFELAENGLTEKRESRSGKLEVKRSKKGKGRNDTTESVKNDGKNQKKKRWKILWIICAILIIYTIPGLYCGLTVRQYEIRDPRIQGQFRIALVTDLHSCKYGKGQEKLLTAIEEQHPDIVLLGGDIFDDERADDLTVEFLSGISGKYPCYYVTGNHECWSGTQAFQKKMAILENYGIVRLAGENVTLHAGGSEVLLCGVDDPHIIMIGTDPGRKYMSFEKELAAMEEALQNSRQGKSIKGESFSILLTHRPELFETYVEGGFDLVLAGHAHGGQWRIPGIMNGYYAPNQGLFPKYAGGYYEKNGTVMIVSRGLARESTPVPRIYNPPELVIVDLMNNSN